MTATQEIVKKMNDNTDFIHNSHYEWWYFLLHIDGIDYTSQMFTAEALALYAWDKNFIDWQ